MTEMYRELRGWNERAAHCTRRSRERVGSLNSLVHSRALRFGFPVCMRACLSVRSSVRAMFVFMYVFRRASARSYVYVCVTAAPVARGRGLSAKKKERKKRKENNARVCEAARVCERTRKREDEDKEEGRRERKRKEKKRASWRK